jgi:hypothetical protein
MLRRAALISLLVFQALWLNVILPGHTRGAVTLAGFEEQSSCHETRGGGCCSHSGGSPQNFPPDDDQNSNNGNRAAHCAICFFAARLTVPVTIDLTPAPLELAFVQPPPVVSGLVSRGVVPTYLGRAPPAA